MIIVESDMYNGFYGGLFIGLAATLLLLFRGRVTGISGILYGILRQASGDWAWRVFFVLGLLSGGLILKFFFPDTLEIDMNRSPFLLGTAGLLVGYGTLLGNGCTSGHGVCGISRLSRRSIVATIIFITFGMGSTYWVRLSLEGVI